MVFGVTSHIYAYGAFLSVYMRNYIYILWGIDSWLVFGLFLAIVGDITPSDNVPKKEKSRMEAAALNEMCIVLGGGMRGITCSYFCGVL